ncbi:MAG: glycosyltransferase family 4 protein [Thermomicrobiales bacterium]
MDILQVLYFYTPYKSGLTIYAERLSAELVKRGHRVTVLTSWHDRSLPRVEITESGVRVVRVPIAANLDRAVIMPGFLPTAARLLPKHDVLHLHLPMVEAAGLAALGRAFRKRVIVTHHADLELDGSLLTRLAPKVGRWSSIGSGRLAHRTIANTQDQASISPTVTRVGKNVSIIPPPIVIPIPSADAREHFREERDLGTGPVIGYVGRFTSEKGLDILMQTIPMVLARFPNAIFALAGPNRDARTDLPLSGSWDEWIHRYQDHVRVLGILTDQELADFYAALDVLALPSTNGTETFGMVQVEAMLCGTPSVSSDLPGVREPVRMTRMGRTSKAGNMEDLAAALVDVLSRPEHFARPATEIAQRFSLAQTVDAYERVYRGED